MSPARKAKIAGGILAATLLATTALSSWATQSVAGRFEHHPLLGQPIAASFYQPFAWLTWQQQPWAAQFPRVFLPWKLGAMGLGFAVCAGFLGVVVRTGRSNPKRRLVPPPKGGLRPIEPAVTDNLGHSQWRSMEDAMDLFPGPDPRHGGVVVGEAYRVDQDTVAKVRFRPRDRSTWGKGGAAPLLIDPCTEGSGHSLIFAGSGAFKTTSAVSTALHWTGSSVILDPSTELGPMLDAAMKAQGKQVVHIGIPSEDPDMPPATGFNVLAWIDITSPEAEVHCRTVISWIADEAPTGGHSGRTEDPFFGAMGKELGTCLLAHVLWDAPPEARTLATLAAAIAIPEDDMLTLLAGINATSSSQMARRIAGTMMRCRAEETFSGVFLSCVRNLSWIFTDAYADLVSRGDFDPATLLTGRTTVFLNIGLRTLETGAGQALARVLVGSLLNTVYEADGRTVGRILFLLDEAARLGPLRALETARDTGRKYRVSLHLMMQSFSQLEIWGKEGPRVWTDSASWVGFASIRAGGSGKDLSDQLGSYGVLAHSEGHQSGTSRQAMAMWGSQSAGANENVHEIRKSLMTAAEMQSDLRADEIIIVPASGFPIRCGRAIFFRRPEMVEQVAANRFAAAAE